MKAQKIIYWIATIWLALGMVSTGIVQVFKLQAKMEYIAHLGFPGYFLTLLGVWKLLGAVAVLMPKYPLIKEYAYAGMFFMMTGALYSHIAFGDAVSEMFPRLIAIGINPGVLVHQAERKTIGFGRGKWAWVRIRRHVRVIGEAAAIISG